MDSYVEKVTKLQMAFATWRPPVNQSMCYGAVAYPEPFFYQEICVFGMDRPGLCLNSMLIHFIKKRWMLCPPRLNFRFHACTEHICRRLSNIFYNLPCVFSCTFQVENKLNPISNHTWNMPTFWQEPTFIGCEASWDLIQGIIHLEQQKRLRRNWLNGSQVH